MKKSAFLALGIGAVFALGACAGPVGTPGNPSPSFSPGPDSSPVLKDMCAAANVALEAATYYQQGQPPASQAQLDNLANQIQKHASSAPSADQQYITQIVHGLRVLATTPPDQRDSSAPVQAFVAAMDKLGLGCNAVGLPIKTPANFPALTSTPPPSKPPPSSRPKDQQ